MERVNTNVTIDEGEILKVSHVKPHKTLKCRDFTCGVIFIIYMIVNLVICGVSIFNGHFQNIGKVVDSMNMTCGNGTNLNFPYLYYPTPCHGSLKQKICVSACPNTSHIQLNTSPDQNISNCLSRTFQNNVTCKSCELYNSYLYLGKICVPTDTNNEVQPILQKQQTQIVLSNIRVCYKEILYLSGIIIVIAFASYFIQIVLPSIIYGYIGILFVCILLLAFLILKLAEIRREQLSSQFSNTSILLRDQNKQQAISYLLFTVYFICFPLLMLIKQRLKKAIAILKYLRYFFNSSGGIHLLNLISIITLYIQFSFEIFALMNYYTNGKINNLGSSPFYQYIPKILHTATTIFMYIGFIWLVSFTISFHKFIICSYTNIWFIEEGEDSPAFNPLQRSLMRSYYNFGSICLDAIIYPFNLFLMCLYSMNKNNAQVNEEETNCCALFFNRLSFKIKKAIESAFQFINPGGISTMPIHNQNYFLSSKDFANAHLLSQNKYLGFGTILSIYTSLFIVMVSLVVSFFVLFFVIMNPVSPPIVSSLIIPLIIIFLFSLCIGTIIGNTLGYGLDTMILCTLIIPEKPAPERYVFQICKLIEQQ